MASISLNLSTAESDKKHSEISGAEVQRIEVRPVEAPQSSFEWTTSKFLAIFVSY